MLGERMKGTRPPPLKRLTLRYEDTCTCFCFFIYFPNQFPLKYSVTSVKWASNLIVDVWNNERGRPIGRKQRSIEKFISH